MNTKNLAFFCKNYPTFEVPLKKKIQPSGIYKIISQGNFNYYFNINVRLFIPYNNFARHCYAIAFIIQDYLYNFYFIFIMYKQNS